MADLLYLAKLEREPERSRVPVRLEVVLSVVREATPLDPDVAIRVTRLDDATVSGDALGLQQLVLNLIDNALHASPPGAEVTIALAAGPDHATVTVSDDGPGIGPGQLERIFDRFYSRPGQSATPPGTGLGLAIAREIARDHDGELTAHNREQAGASFKLTLPLTPSRSTLGPVDARQRSPFARVRS